MHYVIFPEYLLRVCLDECRQVKAPIDLGWVSYIVLKRCMQYLKKISSFTAHGSDLKLKLRYQINTYNIRLILCFLYYVSSSIKSYHHVYATRGQFSSTAFDE